ncbi:EAL domain-containing protein [Psychrosphaera sp. 1_MG-2023]|uniref:EAL domain-containing protein n=1 Tax=Psychrosphaera sp. 1_MG-2023 TaxID=3062643 RepID=UPI0026E445EF|nr:EAL domain-containing protein [Psychrosphaera sp. 1_MG-2023]MDO6720224.1 EAL domain-containing protein [Psychrosphaera sp. 1_MG-2023]
MDRKLPLLLITSDPKNRVQLSNRIRSLQLFDIHTVENSRSAIEKLKNNNFHFIISDIDIGDVDGWCLSSLIRSDIYVCDRKIPIVLLTDTHSERIAEATAKAFGINAVLTKSETSKVNEILADAFSLSLPISSKMTALNVMADKSLASEIELLIDSKFETFTVPNAKDGLAILRQQNIDFLIVDNALPDNTASELIKAVHQELPEIPCVVIVPRNDIEVAEYYMIHGASDFIYRPLNPSRVLNICERAARRNDFMISNNQFAQKVSQLEQSERKFRDLFDEHTTLLENLSSVVIELDKDGKIKFLNKTWRSLTGFSIERCIGKNLLEFIEVDELGAVRFTAKINSMLKLNQTSSTEEVKIRTAYNYDLWVEIKLHKIIKNGVTSGLSATVDNIHDRKKAEEKLSHLALHDTLTGLYNRYYFDTQLSRLTLLASRGDDSHCLLYIDLDHFKVINDTEGHQTGDMVLREVSQILSQRLRQSDILCRVGGDEFVILLSSTTMENAKTIGNNICKQISDTHFQFSNNTYKISASIGLSEIDGHSTAPEYLRQADIALYVAKNKGRNQIHCFAEDDVESTMQFDNMKWVHRLQDAVINDNLILHFQPVWDLEENKVAYFEALVRLQHGDTLTYPNEFIPALERAEDISFLDHQVINQALKSLSSNPELHRVAINLSAHAFSDERLAPLIESKLKKYNVDGHRIIFELTESASLTNVSGTRRMIETISALGCEFSIDDFGTGFSTFAYLKELPAHSVKIDGSFVKDMNNNSVDKTLVSAIAEVATALGKTSVAEFVENADIFDELLKMGVRYAQGYYIGRPLQLDDVKDFQFAHNKKAT